MNNQPTKIIVVGGNAAGPAAAAKAKRTNPDADVIMFEAGEFISAGTCELPYVLSGEIDNYKNIVFFDGDSFYEKKGVKVYTRHLVESIDRKLKRISVRNLNDNNQFDFDYDKLILATGSIAKQLPIIPAETKNVFHLKSVTDYLKIKSYLTEQKVENVLIIGSGYIGLEASEAFKYLGMNVTLLEKFALPMPGTEDEIQHLILDSLKENDINFVPHSEEAQFIFKDNRLTALKYEGWNKKVDLVLSCIGFEPNNKLAVSAQLSVGNSGGLKVNRKLQTSDPSIFACGDNTEVSDFVTGSNTYIPLATVAHLHGHIAGTNAAGGNEFTEPVVKNIAVKLFDKTLCSVGLTSAEAHNAGFTFNFVSTVAPSIIQVMPNSSKTFGKIIFEKDTRKILGASFYGDVQVIGYGDLISAFIKNKLTIDKIADVDYNYTPPRSPFVNILSILGRKSQKESK